MTPLEAGKPIDILLVEDNPGDARLVQEVLRESKLSNNLHIVSDGVEALAYLHRTGRYAGSSSPLLILLDMNLPRMDGKDVLKLLKRDPNLRRIPVIVLTSSAHEEDLLRAHDLQASRYIRKPVELPQFQKVVREIEAFWFKLVDLPLQEPTGGAP